jgi:hypothetical protein
VKKIPVPPSSMDNVATNKLSVHSLGVPSNQSRNLSSTITLAAIYITPVSAFHTTTK